MCVVEIDEGLCKGGGHQELRFPHKGNKAEGLRRFPLCGFLIYATFSRRRIHFNSWAGIKRRKKTGEGGTKAGAATAGILIFL